MNPPTQDPADNPDVPDAELLWRRVLPIRDRVAWVDDTRTTIRPSSPVFIDNHTGEVSVHLESKTTVETVLTRYPDVGIVAVPAGLVREYGYWIVWRPTEEDPHHHVIYNPNNPRVGVEKKHATKLAKSPLCLWRHCPGHLIERLRQAESSGT